MGVQSHHRLTEDVNCFLQKCDFAFSILQREQDPVMPHLAVGYHNLHNT